MKTTTNFDVYDFKPEDELELGPYKSASKLKNPKVLENGAWRTNILAEEMGNLPCSGVDEVDNNRNGDIALSDISFTKGDPATEKMPSLNDDLLLGFSRPERHPQFVADELKHETLSPHSQPRVLSAQAVSPGDNQLNRALPDSKSSDYADDDIPDADESPSESSPSTTSFIPGDDVPLEGIESLADHCFGSLQTGDRVVAIVHPDYIVYRGRYSTESVLIFSCSSLELKDSNTHGNQGISRFEWEIDDIIDIQSQWSERLEIAMVKLRLMSRDAQDDIVVEELQFVVVDLNWHAKQEEIMSLDVRYKALWEIVFITETGGDGEVLPGKNGECISRRRYFPNFGEPFDEVVYPKGDPDAVSISNRDVDLLQPDTFVNDTIIDFYIKYLKNEMLPEERCRFHFFNSFFFRKLIDLDKDSSSAFEGRAAFQRVRKWTRKVDLFEKDYVFIPVNYNYHWSLIVICHPGEVSEFLDEDVEKSLKVPCILHLDSIRGTHTDLKDLVQSYLWEEWKERHKEAFEDISSRFFNLRFVPLELPQQQNSFDCGLFLLHYVERFLEEAPINFSPFKITNYSNFLNLDWFPPAEPSLKRVQIQRLICKILEGENSPAACSSKLASNSEIETNVEVISKRCNPSKNTPGNLSGSQAGEGIEITLLQTSSQCGGDSSLVLREFFDARASAGSLLDGQYQTFDQTGSFNELKGSIAHMEDAEHHDFGEYPETSICDPENFEEYPVTSICGSGYSSEVEVQENNTVGENLGIEEKLDQPKSPLAENLECVRGSLVSMPNEMPDVDDSQSSDHILNSNGNADYGFISLNHPALSSHQECDAQEYGVVACVNVGVISDTLTPKTDAQRFSEDVAENLVSATDGDQGRTRIGDYSNSELDEQQAAERIGDDLVSESDGQLAAKRTGDVSLSELDEQQPTKRPRLAPLSKGNEERPEAP